LRRGNLLHKAFAARLRHHPLQRNRANGCKHRRHVYAHLVEAPSHLRSMRPSRLTMKASRSSGAVSAVLFQTSDTEGDVIQLIGKSVRKEARVPGSAIARSVSRLRCPALDAHIHVGQDSSPGQISEVRADRRFLCGVNTGVAEVPNFAIHSCWIMT